MSLETFTPDDDYCVYCHAIAAGMCAECGAICCAECVELVMGWTTQRAVCTSCLQRDDSNTDKAPRSRTLMWVLAAGVLLIALILSR